MANATILLIAEIAHGEPPRHHAGAGVGVRDHVHPGFGRPAVTERPLAVNALSFPGARSFSTRNAVFTARIAPSQSAGYFCNLDHCLRAALDVELLHYP